MKRHHWLLVLAASLFVSGWLLWNALLVEEDLSGPGAESGPASAPP
jgi:hypothetical protein